MHAATKFLITSTRSVFRFPVLEERVVGNRLINVILAD